MIRGKASRFIRVARKCQPGRRWSVPVARLVGAAQSFLGVPIAALSRDVDAPASMMKKIGISSSNIFGGAPDPVGSI